MATYTVDQIKDLTSVATVANWSDDKILLFQSTAEAILASLSLDTTMSGYASAYNSAVIHLFDWVAENPTGLRATVKGKINRQFGFDSLPGPVRILLQPYISGECGTLTPITMQRRDIGLR